MSTPGSPSNVADPTVALSDVQVRASVAELPAGRESRARPKSTVFRVKPMPPGPPRPAKAVVTLPPIASRSAAGSTVPSLNATFCCVVLANAKLPST